MSMEILHDRRIRTVAWHDLTHLSRYEVVKELLFSLPWLALSLYLAYRRFYLLALTGSFMFFLAGLRQVHNAFHRTLGISGWACDGVMFLLSVLMLGSMHAVQFNHLRHHRHCMDDEDVEAMSARMSAFKALALGPLFPWRMHKAALQGASAPALRWITAELLANVALIFSVVVLWRAPVLKYHIVCMAIGQCLASFFCVWTVHHDCDRSHFIARTLRDRLKNILSFNMFFHVEHHLFPQVPTCHLRPLAERLDQAAPELRQMQVF